MEGRVTRTCRQLSKAKTDNEIKYKTTLFFFLLHHFVNTPFFTLVFKKKKNEKESEWIEGVPRKPAMEEFPSRPYQ